MVASLEAMIINKPRHICSVPPCQPSGALSHEKIPTCRSKHKIVTAARHRRIRTMGSVALKTMGLHCLAKKRYGRLFRLDALDAAEAAHTCVACGDGSRS